MLADCQGVINRNSVSCSIHIRYELLNVKRKHTTVCRKQYSWEFVSNFITNNTTKIQLKILGERFGSLLVLLSTLKAYVMLGLKP